MVAIRRTIGLALGFTLAVSGCGLDETRGERPPPALSLPSTEAAWTSPIEPEPTKAPIDTLVLEWTLSLMSMEDLVGETLVYQEPQTQVVYRGEFERAGLMITARLEANDGFVPMVASQWFRLEPSAFFYPVQFWSVDRSAVVQVMGCDLDLPTGTFLCEATAAARAAVYHLRVVSDLAQVPRPLVCIDGCPTPKATANTAFFVRKESTVAVDDQLLVYSVDRDSGALLHGGRPIVPRGDLAVVTGALFEPTDAHLDGLRCDLDGDQRAKETCVWQPIERFYTYSVRAKHILPFRGRALVGTPFGS